MSTLAEEIVGILARRRGDRRHLLAADEVDAILEDLKVPASATKAIPVPLRVARIHFSGTKLLKPTHPDAHGRDAIEVTEGAYHNQTSITGAAEDDISILFGDEPDEVQTSEDEDASPIRLVPVPFSFQWRPQAGVNGIGSGRNLRGKSTILNVLMWSLTGRCARFQDDIKQWIQHVEVDWTVGPERLQVTFDSRDGHATGQVVKLGDVGVPDRPHVLGEFDGDDFGTVMGSLMMPRLHLEHIPVWTNTQKRMHAWPAYSSAFVVRANQLDPIVGNEQTLGIRMMQMFVGTEWAPAQAAATTARRGMEAEQSSAAAKAIAAGDAVRQNRLNAQQTVDAVKEKVAALPAEDSDLKTVLNLSTRASELARQVHLLEGKLIAQAELADTARQQLRAAKARRHTKHETALATRFFHRMRPSVCPRCAAEVTAERQAAEPTKHECSVCTSSLNLEALESDVIVAASVPTAVTSALMTGAITADTGDDGPIDEIEAATAALSAAEQRTTILQQQIRDLATQRDTAAAEAEASRGRLRAAESRRTLEIELARAEGALDALTQSSDPTLIDPVDPVRAAVAGAAEQILQKWVKDEQDPLLKLISTDVERLADSFGASNLSRVRLNGAASMSMLKGARTVTYTDLTEGEKLRVKIATAIALVKHGYANNIGRHPGLLVLDSPAAEEMPEADLATMVEALQAVAQEAEMQIFVATRNAGPLVALLPAASRVVAEGDNYVW
ncbi:ATP-binding protein [Micromonospora chokoriensis]|uniref:ATP-binding protein n=1 Tax=Micromonospora chokoriensis TaxID=356851 RepID=UPI0004C38CB5|nr:ATP-binding protein [Micromonospora chokoriensis]